MNLRIAIPAACALSLALPAAAQTYPAKPVRIIVPYAAGGNTDLTARAVAEKMTEAFKRQVIVENRPGGATNQSGRIRGIAIGSLKRFPAVPDLPTFDESGVKGYEATTWFGMLAPAKTPKEILTRLNVEVDKAVKSADVRERFINDGLEPMGGSPDSFGKFIRAEIDKYAKVIKVTGIQKQ